MTELDESNRQFIAAWQFFAKRAQAGTLDERDGISVAENRESSRIDPVRGEVRVVVEQRVVPTVRVRGARACRGGDGATADRR